jgi:hypothetical protein
MQVTEMHVKGKIKALNICRKRTVNCDNIKAAVILMDRNRGEP